MANSWSARPPRTSCAPFAAAPASNAATTGSVTFRIGVASLLQTALKRAPSPFATQLLGMLGDVTGSAEASTDGLTGAVSIPVK
jgi:hypothetical protein